MNNVVRPTPGESRYGIERNSDRAFDLQRREADAVVVVQHLVRDGWLAIDADQVVVGLERPDVSLKHLLDSGAIGGFDVVCIATGVIGDEKNFHAGRFWVWGCGFVICGWESEAAAAHGWGSGGGSPRNRQAVCVGASSNYPMAAS